MNRTFVEKIFNANAGAIVFAKPDIVLTHDNTASIKNTFNKMGGEKIADPNQMLIVLDHNAPPTSARLANDYRFIRAFVREQGIQKFYDAGRGHMPPDHGRACPSGNAHRWQRQPYLHGRGIQCHGHRDRPDRNGGSLEAR